MLTTNTKKLCDAFADGAADGLKPVRFGGSGDFSILMQAREAR